jgi:hypothetical protein
MIVVRLRVRRQRQRCGAKAGYEIPSSHVIPAEKDLAKRLSQPRCWGNVQFGFGDAGLLKIEPVEEAILIDFAKQLDARHRKLGAPGVPGLSGKPWICTINGPSPAIATRSRAGVDHLHVEGHARRPR